MTEIYTTWSLVDLFNANCLLNALDIAESEAQRSQKAPR